ncbi:unnamed protein product [Angiostrongylus costaricensis]|uniref:Transmembrane protein n=1 Tax=Angiostrongylus costaricensis TaxID=334426 RepID=A0A0R3PTS4_ANGCS|nr:unnamed protein product [Angiostrongylus costaricensis]
MAKVEVQIRSCLCCGLSLATVFVAIYTLILYSLLTGLAAWGLSDTLNNGDSSHYRSCDLEAQGKLTAENRKLTFHGGHTTVVVEDSTTYHCSFGLYTEELKYEAGLRYTTLVVNIFVYVCVVLASILMLLGLLIYNQWLLVPWMIIMAIDIIRGFISVLFIFIYSYGNLARIATAIFFLGLQFFHNSLSVVESRTRQPGYLRSSREITPPAFYDIRGEMKNVRQQSKPHVKTWKSFVDDVLEKMNWV